MNRLRVFLAPVLVLLASCGGGQSEGSSSAPDGGSDDFSANGFEVTSTADFGSLSCADRLTAEGSLEIAGEPGAQLRFTRDAITNRKIAFIRATFADTPESARVAFPSVADLEEQFLGPDSSIQTYLGAMSYGQFALSGAFVADIELGVPAEIDGRTPEIPELGIVDINIPNFSESDYDLIVMVIISDAGRGRSEAGQMYTSDGFQFTVNGAQLSELCGVIAQYGHVGNSGRDDSTPFQNDFDDLTQIVAIPGDENNETEVTVPLTNVEKTFIHELIHALGVQSHAYSSTNGDRVHNDDLVDGNGDFLWRDYGNRYDIMGSGDYSFALNAGYRERLGWIGDARTVRIDQATERFPVALQPLDSADGNVLAEVRLPGRFFLDDPVLAALERTENQGYLFEVWPTDNKYYWMGDIGLPGGSGGLVIYRTDGYTAAVLDASPSSNIDYSWGTDYDLGDIALRPGQVFDDGFVRVENVELLNDGSVTFDVTLHQTQ